MANLIRHKSFVLNGSLLVKDKGPNTPMARGDINCSRQVMYKPTATDVTTAITGAQYMGRVITCNVTAGNVTITLPTAADLISNIRNARIGDVVKCLIVAYGSGANLCIVSAAVTGVTVPDAQPANFKRITGRTSNWVYAKITNVVAPAVTYY